MRKLRLVLNAFSALVLMTGCGTAKQPSSSSPLTTVAPPSPVVSGTPVPDCPNDTEFRPDAGCVYQAAGTPPSSPGIMRPIPEGEVGKGDSRRRVRSFWMDERRVRLGEYRACVEAGACSSREAAKDCSEEPDKPASCVGLKDAEAYCTWVKKRLLTDDEWERALESHQAFGLTELEWDAQEWTMTYFCDEKLLGGCGHSRVTRGGGKPEERSRMSDMGVPWVDFRCAWSERPPSASESPPPQVPLTSATPGTLSCHTTTCALNTSICCLNDLDGVGYCIPREENSQCKEGLLRAQCDENADCHGGEVCCPYWGCSGGCPPELVCQKPPCDYGPEMCQPGGQCRNGFSCVTRKGQRRGECMWQDVGAQCGGKRCSGDTPVCCWDPKTGKGTCSKSRCDNPALEQFACTSPKDCGGSVCVVWTNGDPDAQKPGFECGSMSHLVQAMLCDTKKDCSAHPPTGTPPKACRHTKTLPPGVKECIYFDEQ